MVRIALDLSIIEFADSSLWADPCYLPASQPPHALTAYYVPTPGLLCYLGQLLLRARMSGKLAIESLNRMQKNYDDLASVFQVAAVPVRPSVGETATEFLALSDFLASDSSTLYGPPVPIGEYEYVKGKRGKEKTARPILAWRPRLPEAGTKILGGLKTIDDGNH